MEASILQTIEISVNPIFDGLVWVLLIDINQT